MFDTVLVISDRNVIDSQLQEAIFGFERTTGVVARIKGDGGSKSSELAEALSGDKKIVVCTIQTFPFAIKAVRELAATGGKRFAVIPDEAHSSQTGEAASKLKQVLSAEEQKELADGGDVSSEDILIATMTSRADDQGITYVAYTATPKAKTLELFGRRPDPSKPARLGNLPGPFHVYSMRQAIEEGFILDVLQNYTSYKLAFKLANDGKEFDDKEVERSAAMKKLMGWVKLHPYNIAQKVQIVVEHYRETVAPLLDGKPKAMVVVSSRLEAVRWQLAINKYIKDKGYPLTTVVAFTEAGSGSVQEKEKAYLSAIISKVNDLFKGELTDNAKLVYVNNVIMGKLLESQTLIQQATNNSKEQFANSPDLKTELMNAIIDALEAHTTMSTQALGSEVIRDGLRDILLGPAKLYETLRKQVENKVTGA